MKAIAAVLLLSLFGVGHAVAADLPLPSPAPPTNYYPVVPPVNWSGLYVGVNGGYGFGSSNWTNAGASTGGFTTNGGLAGGTLGINYTGVGNGFLLGLEGDFDWSGIQGTSSIAACTNIGGPGNSGCQFKNDWLSTIRLRAGYTFGHFLVFGTGGGAMGGIGLGLSPPGSSFNPGPQLGWTVGGGVEYAFTDALSAKVEYLYVNLGTLSCPAGSCGAVTAASVSASENLVRAGVNYKFTW